MREAMRCLKVSSKCEGCEMYRPKVDECSFKNVAKGLLNERLSMRGKAEVVNYLLKFLDV